MHRCFWVTGLALILSGCSAEKTKKENLEKFNMFELRLAIDAFQKELDANSKHIPHPDDIDHSAQMAMDACRQKPYAAEFKKIHDMVLEFQLIAKQRPPKRKEVIERLAAIKSALDQFENK